MNFNFGYKFNKYISEEAGFFYLLIIKYTGSGGSHFGPLQSPGSHSSNLYAFNVALKGFMPITSGDSFYAFAKLGVAYTIIDLKNHSITDLGPKDDDFSKGLTGFGSLGLGGGRIS